MAGVEDREDALKALHRMIVYARAEAARLRVADAALLLGYAENAIVTLDLRKDDDELRSLPRDLPIVQH